MGNATVTLLLESRLIDTVACDLRSGAKTSLCDCIGVLSDHLLSEERIADIAQAGVRGRSDFSRKYLTALLLVTVSGATH